MRDNMRLYVYVCGKHKNILSLPYIISLEEKRANISCSQESCLNLAKYTGYTK